MDLKQEIESQIENTDSRILELGPLNNPFLSKAKYNNYFFADIRSTEEIKQLYTGNEYLKRTGISVDLEKIIEIDFVIKDSYKETFKDTEKFDYVIVSHVLEHIPNLLFFFEDIQNILKEDGKLIIIYPERRFSFDHYRSESKFSDIYDVYKKGEERTASQVLDFYSNVLKENNPTNLWNIDFDLNLPEEKNNEDLKLYESVIGGEKEGDIHYWPFSDQGFLKFLYDCKKYQLFNVNIENFIPTQINTQAFLVIMSFSGSSDNSVFMKFMQEANQYYYKNYYKILNYEEEIEKNRLKIIDEKEKIFRELLPLLSNSVRTYEENQKYIRELENLIVEKSRIRNMIKGLIVKIFLLIKKVFLFIPRKVMNKINRKGV